MSKSITRAEPTVPAGRSARVSFRASGFHFSGGGVSSLGRVGVPAPGRTRGVQNPRVPAASRQAVWLARLHTLEVGVPPGLRQSGAMPPFSCQHPCASRIRALLGGRRWPPRLRTTGRPTRTHNIRKPLCGMCCVPVASNVIGEKTMSNVLAFVPPAVCAAPSVSAWAGSRSSGSAQLPSLLWGTIPSARAGLTPALRRWPALSALSCAVVGSRRAGAQPAPFFWGSSVGTRKIGAPAWSRSGHNRIQPHTCEHRGGKLRVSALPWLALASAASDNKSLDTDPQLQKAASPQGLRSGCLQRYR